MSNSILNIRFGSYHFKINRDRPYVSFTHNPFHDNARKKDPEWKWFEIMEFNI